MGNMLPKPSTEYMIHVQTGDKKFAGTDSNVTITLFDELGNKSEPISLVSVGRNNFEKGTLDSFHVPVDDVSNLRRSAKIIKIQLSRDSSFMGSNWYVEKIVVQNRTSDRVFVFPVLHWINADKIYTIKLYATCLPHKDDNVEQRTALLTETHLRYTIDQHIINGPVQAKELPADEDFSFSYMWDLAALLLKTKGLSTIKAIMNDEFDTIQDMLETFDEKLLPRPGTIDKWNTDAYFGYQRLGRVNHSAITLVKNIPHKFPVTNEMLQPFLEGLTITDAIAKKKLFIVDYNVLEGITCKQGYVVCAPIALFFLDKTGNLMPVAIQLNQKPGNNNPIFTPNINATTWTLVKMWFNNSDSIYHQAVQHLTMTHLVMEGFALASNRHLSSSHPIYRILAPHFLYIIAINNMALTGLIGVGGWVDQTMNCGRDGIHELISRTIDKWRMDMEGTITEDMKNRGVEDAAVLPNYHYRDDALLIYNAILKYVTAYVNLYYTKFDDIAKDWEIQNWAQELAKPRNKSEGGIGFLGIPGKGKLTSTSQLIQIITAVIFTCSVTHAAANFPQYEEYSFPPNYPSLMKGTPPTNPNVVTTEKDLVKCVANQKEMLDMMTFTKLLSTKGTKSLGDFEVTFIFDPKACELVDAFRQELIGVSRTITERNRLRKYSYPYLDPLNIPNSIGI